MSDKVGNMDLTAVEINMILEHRAKQAKIAEAKEQTRLLLDYAATYGIWLLETGNGSTYTTFCEHEGFDSTLLKDRSEAYNAIMTIIGTAKEYAAGHGMVCHQ